MQSNSKRRTRLRVALSVALAAASLALAAPATVHAAPPDPSAPVATGSEGSPYTRPANVGLPVVRSGPVATPPTDPEAVTVPPGATVPSLATDALVQIALIQGGSGAAQTSFGVIRSQIAEMVGYQLGIDAEQFDEAWTAADLTHQTALMAAFSQIGTPYRSQQSKPGVGFDCSGLTSYAWSVAGLTIPRSSGDQIAAGTRLTAETAGAGDLVQYPGHVMMYLGVPGTMVHSPYSGRRVEVDFIPGKRINSVRYADPS